MESRAASVLLAVLLVSLSQPEHDYDLSSESCQMRLKQGRAVRMKALWQGKVRGSLGGKPNARTLYVYVN